MPKITYVATFANGTTITRKTARTYTHAWRVLDNIGATVVEGFSGSERLARNAAAQYINHARTSEIAACAIAPEGFEKQCAADKPYTVRMHYEDGRTRVETDKGNKARRFATWSDAQAYADTRRPRRDATFQVHGPAQEPTARA